MSDRIWVIADTHLNHPKLIEKGDRTEGYEERIAINWRRLVEGGDLVVHLGDVIFKQASTLTAWMYSVPGTKVLVRGNHDHESKAWYRRRGFDVVLDALEMDHRGVRILMTHEPRVPVPSHVHVNVHGHLHADRHRAADYGLDYRLAEQAGQVVLVECDTFEGPKLLDDLLEGIGCDLNYFGEDERDMARFVQRARFNPDMMKIGLRP